MKNKQNNQGFTLIELLVVITIIAILASVSVPVYSSVQRSARLTKSLAQAKGIQVAMYAEWGKLGYIPDPENGGDDANAYLAPLIRKLKSEEPFFVTGCAWHGRSDTRDGGDSLYETSNPAGIALEAGENHYAMNKMSDFGPRFPILASGFTSNVGTYTDKKTDVGGVWEGLDAIIIYGDGRGKQVSLDEQFRYLENKGGTKVDVFQAEEVEMVNPTQG